MASGLLIVGLLLNVTGVVVGSSRDLARLLQSILDRSWRLAQRLRSRLAASLRRLFRRPLPTVIASGACGISVASGGSGTAFVWDSIPDDAELPAVIQSLRLRTDSLRQMLEHDRNQNHAESGRVTDRVNSLAADFERALSEIQERIDDFDTKPSGQRAFGAVLVICGTAMMSVAGFVS